MLNLRRGYYSFVSLRRWFWIRATVMVTHTWHTPGTPPPPTNPVIAKQIFSLAHIKTRAFGALTLVHIYGDVTSRVKEAEKWTFKSNIWKPKISFFVIKKP